MTGDWVGGASWMTDTGEGQGVAVGILVCTH